MLLNWRACVHAGGLLSEDSPFLDVVREGLKLALPSAELTHPHCPPAIGAALLVRQRLYGTPASEEGGEDGGARLGDRDPFSSPLHSPGALLRTPDGGMQRHRHHHRRTPSSLGACVLRMGLPFCSQWACSNSLWG